MSFLFEIIFFFFASTHKKYKDMYTIGWSSIAIVCFTVEIASLIGHLMVVKQSTIMKASVIRTPLANIFSWKNFSHLDPHFSDWFSVLLDRQLVLLGTERILNNQWQINRKQQRSERSLLFSVYLPPSTSHECHGISNHWQLHSLFSSYTKMNKQDSFKLIFHNCWLIIAKTFVDWSFTTVDWLLQKLLLVDYCKIYCYTISMVMPLDKSRMLPKLQFSIFG